MPVLSPGPPVTVTEPPTPPIELSAFSLPSRTAVEESKGIAVAVWPLKVRVKVPPVALTVTLWVSSAALSPVPAETTSKPKASTKVPSDLNSCTRRLAGSATITRPALGEPMGATARWPAKVEAKAPAVAPVTPVLQSAAVVQISKPEEPVVVLTTLAVEAPPVSGSPTEEAPTISGWGELVSAPAKVMTQGAVPPGPPVTVALLAPIVLRPLQRGLHAAGAGGGGVKARSPVVWPLKVRVKEPPVASTVSVCLGRGGGVVAGSAGLHHVLAEGELEDAGGGELLHPQEALVGDVERAIRLIDRDSLR